MTDHAGEFVSESIQPDAGTFQTQTMARGQPGLPAGFTWRDRHYAIVEVLEEWKVSEAEYHRSGERYYRKHFWRLHVDTGDIMMIYALRQVKAGNNPRKRWWLYSIAPPPPDLPPAQGTRSASL